MDSPSPSRRGCARAPLSILCIWLLRLVVILLFQSDIADAQRIGPSLSDQIFLLRGGAPVPENGSVALVPVVRLCQIAWGGSDVGTAAAAVAIAEFPRYAAMYPNISWEYSLLSKNGNLNDPDLAGAVLTATRCDAFLGPSTSQQSVVIAPLVDKVWVSDTATSTELSNKDSFPTFSRVASTALSLGSALAAFCTARGWRTAAVIVSDEAYGKAVGNAFSDGLLRQGGKIAYSQAVPVADEGEFVNALVKVRESGTRLVLLASLLAEPSVDAVVATGMHETHVFLLGESLCSSTYVRERLVGAICAQFFLNSTEYSHLVATMRSIPEAEFAFLSSPPLDLAPWDIRSVSINSALTSDALHFLMQGFSTLFEVKSAMNLTYFSALSTSTKLSWFRRNVTVWGYSGDVELDARGDRVGSFLEVVNLQPNATAQQLALWSSSASGKSTLELTLAPETPLFWMNSLIRRAEPSFLRNEQESEILINPAVILAICVGGFFVLVIIGVAVRLKFASAEKQRRAVRSGSSWKLIGSLTLRLATSAARVVTVYIVATAVPAPSDLFLGFYVALIAVGFGVSMYEVQILVRFFHVVLGDEELTDAECLSWAHRQAKAHVLNLLADDVPMLVLGSVALLNAFNWFILGNVMLCSFIVGIQLPVFGTFLRLLGQEDADQVELATLPSTDAYPGEFQPMPDFAASLRVSLTRKPTTVDDVLHSKTEPKRPQPEGSIGNPLARTSGVLLPIPSICVEGEEGAAAASLSGSNPHLTLNAGRQPSPKPQAGATSNNSVAAAPPGLEWMLSTPSLRAITPEKDQEEDDWRGPALDSFAVEDLVSFEQRLKTSNPGRWNRILAKADEDAVSFESMRFSKLIFYAVYVPHLNHRMTTESSSDLKGMGGRGSNRGLGDESFDADTSKSFHRSPHPSGNNLTACPGPHGQSQNRDAAVNGGIEPSKLQARASHTPSPDDPVKATDDNSEMRWNVFPLGAGGDLPGRSGDQGNNSCVVDSTNQKITSNSDQLDGGPLGGTALAWDDWAESSDSATASPQPIMGEDEPASRCMVTADPLEETNEDEDAGSLRAGSSFSPKPPAREDGSASDISTGTPQSVSLERRADEGRQQQSIPPWH
jgi:hypothetical protein